MRIGLAIDPATNDLFLQQDGSLAVVTEAEAVGQHVRQRLKAFAGEWFLDVTAGVPWIRDIFAKQYNPALAEAVVKNEILNTDGVTAINSFSVRFDRNTRGVIITSVTVMTDYDIEVSI